ncbi:hypothetical protein SAMN05444354_103369 [Stigmatella aurantiaca]|uniref:Lipoprotein n=1 Tax=Stigmatella aurantiaca TaxID=41 RepID=A0A1H7LY41_STIAU|nr:hypothetical protein [Stigmatella aurantiaca]SEL03668.1 hypothetical protein SAMN05444354_103369 [Stigmatella aurantiaca]
MKKLWGAWLVALMLAACGGDDGGGGGGGGGGGEDDEKPGIGPSTKDPVGTPFEWPAGLIVKEPIDAYDEDHCYRDDQKEREVYGHGGNVRLCLGFTNTTNQPITVSLPAGLIFVSLNTESQNGLLVQVETFEVPPGDQPFFVNLGLQCLNAGRDPGFIGDTYKKGPVTQDEELREFLDILKNKKLTLDNAHIVQDALWNVTDGDGLTARDREDIGKL